MHTTSPQNPWEGLTLRYDMLHVRLQLVAEEVVAARPSSVFELGCGVGVLRAELMRALPGLRHFGCDVSQAAVDSIGHPDVVRADLNSDDLPFADRTFDCIVGSGILEYVRDVPGLLAELRTRLAPGGRLVVTYFNMRHAYRRLLLLRGGEPFRHPTWVNDYSVSEFRRLLTGAGFVVRDEIPSNLGLGGSPSIGQERWTAGPLRRLRKVPLIRLFAHQVVLVAEAPPGAAAAEHAG
jgi:SAM-dependent methyltransferase